MRKLQKTIALGIVALGVVCFLSAGAARPDPRDHNGRNDEN
jgi:hypothetical protein